jgi:hypothetical protein
VRQPVSRALRRLRHRIGFRGYFLLTLALVDVFAGLAFVRPASVASAETNNYLAKAIPFNDVNLANWTWAFAWWLVAAFCIVNAFKTERDHWGFGMAVAIKVAYVVTLVYATQHGMPDGWRRVVIWSFVASSVWVMSRWPEPARPLAVLIQEIEETTEIKRIHDDEPEGP